jgi:hypothetical protein
LILLIPPPGAVCLDVAGPSTFDGNLSTDLNLDNLSTEEGRLILCSGPSLLSMNGIGGVNGKTMIIKMVSVLFRPPVGSLEFDASWSFRVRIWKVIVVTLTSAESIVVTVVYI